MGLGPDLDLLVYCLSLCTLPQSNIVAHHFHVTSFKPSGFSLNLTMSDRSIRKPFIVDVDIILGTLVTVISQEELVELNLQKLFLWDLKEIKDSY